MKRWRVNAPQQMLTDVVTGGALVVSMVGMAVALAALVFTGPLSSGLEQATGTFIVGGGIGAAWLAFRSQVVPVVSIVQDAPAVVMVAVLAGIVQQSPQVTVSDVIVLIAVSTALAGAAMLLLGVLGMGEAVRYLPSVVVKGFIAGTGWLLMRGGLEVMVGSSLSITDLDVLVRSATLARWTPGIVLGVVVFIVARSPQIPDVVNSVAVVVAVALFFALARARSSISAVEADGWLIGPFGSSGGQLVVRPGDLAATQWSIFGPHLTSMISLLLVTTVALLLNLSALEATRRTRVDMSHELRTAGIANLAISALPSLPVFHSLGTSTLAQRMGVRRRAVPMTASLTVAALGFAGTELVGYAPVFVAGGLLFAVGLNLLADWIDFLRSPIGWVERTLSAAVLAVIVFFGILEGVVAGLILACAVFVFRYSRVDPIRRAIDGSLLTSRVDRTAAEATALRSTTGNRLIVELQGYLFFGSVVRLVDKLRGDPHDELSISTVVLDFRLVTGVDPGAVQVLTTALDDLRASGVDVMLSGPSPSLLQQFAPSAEPTHQDTIFATLDDALAHSENRLLSELALPPDRIAGDGDPPHADSAPDWLEWFTEVTAARGTQLLTRGEPGDTLMYMVSGTVGVYARSHTGDDHRVRQLRSPTWLGEIGFLRRSDRTADVRADSPVVYAWIDRDDFEALRREQPEVAIQILDHIAVKMASRTTSLTQALTQSLD